MLKVTLTNEILRLIEEIDANRFSAASVRLSPAVENRLRKNSKKKSSYASNRIEGNPLTEEQAALVIDRDEKKHLLKPEQEVRNYYLALNYLEEQKKKGAPFTKKLIMDVQRYVEKGASKEKIGLRGPMPPGVLFAVYDAESGRAEPGFGRDEQNGDQPYGDAGEERVRRARACEGAHPLLPAERLCAR